MIQRYDLEATVPETILDLYPGQPYQMNTTIENLGNGPDRFDVTIESITDSDGNSHVWDIEIPRILFGELDRDEIGEYPIIINVPEKTIKQEHVAEVISITNKKYTPTNQKIIHIVPSNFFVDGIRNVNDPSGLVADKLGVELNYITSETNPLINIENIIKKFIIIFLKFY